MATPNLYIPPGDRLHFPTRKLTNSLLLSYINRVTLDLPPQFHRQYKDIQVSGLSSALRTVVGLDVLGADPENEVTTHTDIFVDRSAQDPGRITGLDAIRTVVDEVGLTHGVQGQPREVFHLGDFGSELSLGQVAWSIHKVAQAVRHH
jgi:hypothetical protein